MSEVLSSQQIAAAQEFAQAAHECLRSTGVSNVIAGCARMSGMFLFRSFGFSGDDMQPGSAVLSDLANEKGPKLMQIFGFVLERLGLPVSGEFAEPSPGDSPTIPILETQRILEPDFERIRTANGLSFEQAAESIAASTAFLTREYNDDIDHDVAFGIGVYSLIEGSKTFPLRYDPDA